MRGATRPLRRLRGSPHTFRSPATSQTQATIHLELPIVTAEGSRRWVRTVGDAVTSEDGTVVKVAGAFQDITTQKSAEQDLRRQQEQLTMAMEGGNIGTWNWDVETDEAIFNRQWAEMLGYTREELNFHFSTWEELVHTKDLKRVSNVLRQYVAGESDTYDPEIRMRTESGHWKWIQTIGKMVDRDSDGTASRIAGIHLDIDERKRAETALRERESQLRGSPTVSRVSSFRPTLGPSANMGSTL